MAALTEIVLEASQPTFNLSLILAVVWIINNDFAKYTTSPLTIGQYAINQRNRLYHNDLINDIIKRAMMTPKMKLYVEGEMKEKGLVEEQEKESESDMNEDEGKEDESHKTLLSREHCIFFLDSITSYSYFERDLLNRKHRYRRSGYFLLVYTGAEKERLDNVKEIFHRLFAMYTTNVNVLLMIGRSPYLYTYFPFTENKCHSSLPEYYISFRNIQKNFSTFQVEKPIFPMKVKNMHGCELVVVTWQYAPYILLDVDPESGELIRLHGVEGSLLSLLAEKMNFKIRLKTPKPLDRGDVYPNGTATGATRMIINAEANITIISLMYNMRRSEVMQASSSYLYVPYVFAIPQGRTMSSFERLMKPFRYIIWSCFSSSILLGIIFIYYIRFLGKSKLMDFIFGQGNRIPFTNLLATLFGFGIHGNVPVRNFARYILLIFLLYTFVLRSAYSGALYNLLQDGRVRNTYKSINELVAQNFTFYAFPAVEAILKQAMPQANTGIVDANNPTTALFKRISSSNNEKLALCLLEYSIRSYNQLNPTRRVEVLDQVLLTAPIVFYMPRHSYLRYHTDDLILRILQAGLMRRYESYYLYSSRQSQPKQREPIKLSLKLLLALFCIYGTFILFSIGIFLLELASAKSAGCRIITDFLNI